MMQRADILLVDQGLVQSRTHAQRLIKNNKVCYLKDQQWIAFNKPGLKLAEETQFKLEEDPADRYVSRGALKLEKGLSLLPHAITGLQAIDVGQSTGGFTDCLLQAGAKAVVGIEVGHDQLAEKLRQDDRVTCLEGVNARDLPHEQLFTYTQGHGFDLAVMDVSFISQTKILPSLVPLIRQGGHLITLVKPQFEVGKEGIGRGGIVRDAGLYPKVEKLIRDCCSELGLAIIHYTESPITGGDGNREFLLIAVK